MNKKFEQMSLKELWQLFPIFLVKHNKEWIKWYEEENQYYQHCRVKAQKEYLTSEARLYQEYGRKILWMY